MRFESQEFDCSWSEDQQFLFAKSPGADTAGALFLRFVPAPFLFASFNE
jgi:hypothetical protein